MHLKRTEQPARRQTQKTTKGETLVRFVVREFFAHLSCRCMAKSLVASRALSPSPRPVIPQPPPPPCRHHPRAVPSSYSQKTTPRTPTRRNSVRVARAWDTAKATLMSGKATNLAVLTSAFHRNENMFKSCSHPVHALCARCLGAHTVPAEGLRKAD